MATDHVSQPWPARLIAAGLANPLLVTLATLGLAFAAIMVLPGPMRAALPQAVTAQVPHAPVSVDAIPDIGENQQIVYAAWPGRSPADIDDQVTYPLTAQLLGLPGVKTVRSASMFGFASIYVIFDEETPFYWSRARILEKLSALPKGALPSGVTPVLGPDATALGQVYWYTLESHDVATGQPAGGFDLHELRAVQDDVVKNALLATPGVAEVASIGGTEREVQIDVVPEKLSAYGLGLIDVARAVKAANRDVGARTVEINRVEYVLRGVGQLGAPDDVADVVLKMHAGRPVRLRDVARVSLGPKARRGALDVNGAEAVGGVVVARFGENPTAVLDRLKTRMAQLAPGLPRRTLEDGREVQVALVPFYDRGEVVKATVQTLSDTLLQQLLITALVVLVLLGRLRAALSIGALLPLVVGVTFVVMKAAGVTANVMSLAGIAIAIGTMVDMAIVVTDALRTARAAQAPGGAPDPSAAAPSMRRMRDAAAIGTVVPAITASALTTVLSFLPVFGLSATEGKLFIPLAITKTVALTAALVLSVVVLPSVAVRLMPAARPATEPGGTRPRMVMAALGLLVSAAAGMVALWLGALVALVWFEPAVVRWASAGAPSARSRAQRVAPFAWRAAAFGLLTWQLAVAWMPLGHGHSVGVNTAAVLLALGLVLGSFRAFIWAYPRLLAWALAHQGAFLTLPTAMVGLGLTIWLGAPTVLDRLPDAVRLSRPAVAVAHAFPGLSSEFMPAFDEGSFLLMPSTLPHASIGQALSQLRKLDAAVAAVPEVESAVGKLGRVDSALDPAPVSMFEVIVAYKPEFTTHEDGTRTRNWRPHIKSTDDIWAAITKAAAQPGLTAAPKLMPIGTRILMLQTGMRAPMGIKLTGPDAAALSEAGLKLEALLKTSPAVRPASVFAERPVGKPYLEVHIDRAAIARHGLSIDAVQNTLAVALGGQALTTLIDGRARIDVRVRYARDARLSLDALNRVRVRAAAAGTGRAATANRGRDVLLGDVADLVYKKGPQVLKSENTFLQSTVIFEGAPGLSEGDVVGRLKQLIDAKRTAGTLALGPGVQLAFAGNFEHQARSEARLRLLVPLALLAIFLVLQLTFRSTFTALSIFSGVATAASGGFMLLWLFGQPWFLDMTLFGENLRALLHVQPVHLSVAVWVGMIAVLGIATDDGVVMATTLRQKLAEARAADGSTGPGATGAVSRAAIRAAVHAAGTQRLRACLMTTATTLLALLPVLTATGRGADVMLPMALPSIGGMLIALITLFVVPVLTAWRAERALRAAQEH